MNRPDRNLRIVLLPIDIVDADVDTNIHNIELRLDNIRDTDIIVLPELTFSGFNADPAISLGISKRWHDCIAAAKRWAAATDSAICGSTIEPDGYKLYNTAFFVTPDGNTHFYRKRHLFCSGPEPLVFSPGMQSLPVIHFRGWNIATAICYDVRFPVWLRNVSLAYDILIVPANWPNSRQYAWNHLLTARAIENQAYVAGCNREGKDLYGDYSRGDSFVFDPWGKGCGNVLEDGTVETVASAEILNTCRRLFTPYRDADKFSII